MIAYKKIGDQYLKQIEEALFETKYLCRVEMQSYFKYWEYRIFNAISIMILRAFAAIHTIFQANVKTERKLRKPLIVIWAENSAEEITFHPSKDELGNQLEKFTKNVLDTAK